MIELDQIFHHVEELNSDAWVADYTDETKGAVKENRQGVVISSEPITNIASFHLVNPNGMSYYAVNFEDNKDFSPQGRKDCECMFRCKEVVERGWLLLLELKYCLDKESNRTQNASKAYEQLLNTWSLLNEKGILNRKQCRSFLNISMPAHKKLPFYAFIATPADRIKLKKEKNVNLMGVNEVLIVNKGILKAIFRNLKTAK